MTHDELSIEVNRRLQVALYNGDIPAIHALCAVVELHKPFQFESGPEEYKPVCQHCQLGVVGDEYPCETIKAIEKELQ